MSTDAANRQPGPATAGAPDPASVAPASPPARRDPGAAAAARIAEALALSRDMPGPPEAARAAALDACAAALAEGRAAIADAARADPARAGRLKAAYAALTDAVLGGVMDFVTTRLHPAPNPTATERLAVIAVGGYGRAEMAPFSDVDILFLFPWKQTAWGESVIESTLYFLWDLKLKLGHASRNIEDCIRLARADLTIRTGLLENRLVWGDAGLAAQLRARLWTDLFATTGPDFIEAKLAERADRHRRQGGSRYLLEPNLKEGKGGLRDLQTLFWIGKYLHRAETPADLVRAGLFTEEECTVFAEAEAFLWTVRIHLHLLAGRAAERLTFDTQVELAQILGYAGSSGQRPVERFMQAYFRQAKAVGDLTRICLSALEAQHVKPRPSLARTIRTLFPFDAPPPADGYTLRNGRLDIADAAAFLADPVNLLRIFHVALSSDTMIHPDALRLVAANLDRVDDALRADPEANRLFLDMLVADRNPERTLRLMNEVGLLGAFIPEFGRIVCLMQFNMYHHYTVDEHTLQCIGTLSEIEQGALARELPIASEIVSRGVSKRILRVALLLHDIGKGTDRDHSELGAEIALRIAPRLGLDRTETETVAWLVRHHLLMSDTAQKRDLADPRTVADFAALVQSPRRLKLLTVLTVCDIRGVGPGVWNNWKAMLIRALYRATLDTLTGAGDAQSRPERAAEAKAALAAALADWPEDSRAAELARHYDPYWLGLSSRTHEIFAQLVRDMEPDKPAIFIEAEDARDATRVCFALPDHPGIFSRLAGALALSGANVRDARTYTSTDGIATAAFWVQDADGHPYDPTRYDRLRRTILKLLKGELIARDAFRDRDRISRRERDFVVPTTITFDNDGSDIYSIIEVDTRDRPGLLYDLTRTLAACNVSIASAIIATYGEQAVDVFYVKDLFGLKLHSAAKRRAIEARLRAAITPIPETEGPAGPT